MDKFLERHNVPRPNEEQLENLNRRINSKNMETLIKNFTGGKRPEADGFIT